MISTPASPHFVALSPTNRGFLGLGASIEIFTNNSGGGGVVGGGVGFPRPMSPSHLMLLHPQQQSLQQQQQYQQQRVQQVPFYQYQPQQPPQQQYNYPFPQQVVHPFIAAAAAAPSHVLRGNSNNAHYHHPPHPQQQQSLPPQRASSPSPPLMPPREKEAEKRPVVFYKPTPQQKSTLATLLTPSGPSPLPPPPPPTAICTERLEMPVERAVRSPTSSASPSHFFNNVTSNGDEVPREDITNNSFSHFSNATREGLDNSYFNNNNENNNDNIAFPNNRMSSGDNVAFALQYWQTPRQSQPPPTIPDEQNNNYHHSSSSFVANGNQTDSLSKENHTIYDQSFWPQQHQQNGFVDNKSNSNNNDNNNVNGTYTGTISWETVQHNLSNGHLPSVEENGSSSIEQHYHQSQPQSPQQQQPFTPTSVNLSFQSFRGDHEQQLPQSFLLPNNNVQGDSLPNNLSQAEKTAGVGIIFQQSTAGGDVHVRGLIPGGAAELSGQIQIEDIVVSVTENNRTVAIQGHAISFLRDLIVGPPGTMLTLNMRRGDDGVGCFAFLYSVQLMRGNPQFLASIGWKQHHQQQHQQLNGRVVTKEKIDFLTSMYETKHSSSPHRHHSFRGYASSSASSIEGFPRVPAGESLAQNYVSPLSSSPFFRRNNITSSTSSFSPSKYATTRGDFFSYDDGRKSPFSPTSLRTSSPSLPQQQYLPSSILSSSPPLMFRSVSPSLSSLPPPPLPHNSAILR